MLTGLVNTISPDSGEVGLRMTGKYGGGRLLLDFSGNSLVLDCGQAHVRQPYIVENTPNAFLVHVNNSGGPFILALQPDGSLLGSGSTTLNGKLVTGMNGDNVTFTPRSERCDVGAFRPKAGSTLTASVANASSAPAPIASASSVDMKLSISTSFPGGPNLLVGRPVVLMSERFDNVMHKAGAPLATSTKTPGMAWLEFTVNCIKAKPRNPQCNAVIPVLNAHIVGESTFDSAGKAILSAPTPGSYFVLTSDMGDPQKGIFVWDTPITLKAGNNTITLSTAEAEHLR